MALDFRSLGNLLRRSLRFFESSSQAPNPARRSTAGDARPPMARPSIGEARGSGPYPGDFDGVATIRYSPAPDGNPDPGEVVWTWVPFEEDHSKGKDRPVLLVGHDGSWLLGLMFTSKDRNNGRQRDEDYLDVGAGAWDRQGRNSEVRLDRVLRVDPAEVRREGAVLDDDNFQRVAKALRSRHGWNSQQ